MQTGSNRQSQALIQLRMGLLGTATAVVFCFAAAFAFADLPNQAAAAELTSSTDLK